MSEQILLYQTVTYPTKIGRLLKTTKYNIEGFFIFHCWVPERYVCIHASLGMLVIIYRVAIKSLPPYVFSTTYIQSHFQ